MKTRYKNKKNCILAMSLALLVLLSSLPLSAIAIDGEQVSDTVQTIMPVIQDTDLLPFADNFMAANQNIEYTVHYYLQGTTISVAPSKVVVGQTMGAYITESAIVVAGYAAVAPTSVTQTLAATGNEIIFYYTTVDVFYVVHYYVAGTTTTVAPSKTGVAGLMGATVTERAVVVAGYTVDANVKTLTLAGSGNVIIFEYKPSSNFVSGFGSNGKFLTVINTPDMNAIKIYNAQDLDKVRNNLAGSYVLMNDIVDLLTINNGQWIPIGSSDVNAFTGTFDGQGFVIYDLVVTDNRQYIGLFGYTRGATIKNVGLENTRINIQNSIGSVAMGGLCGYNSGGSISNCYNVGSVSGPSSDTVRVGGLIGYVTSYSTDYSSGSVSVSNCYNTGDVSTYSPSYNYVGGLIGSVYSYGSVSVSNCYNTGDVSTYSVWVGGLIGSVISYGSVSVSNCYNTGDVSTSIYASGVCVGGLIGYSSGSVSVSSCYSTGDVSSFYGSSVYVGGLIGQVSGSVSVSNCYWNSESVQIVNGIPRGDAEKKGVGDNEDTLTGRLDSAQMQDEFSFVDWDFIDTWIIKLDEDYKFPIFRVRSIVSVETVPSGKAEYFPFDEIEIKITARVNDDWFEKICDDFDNRLELYHNNAGKLFILNAKYDQSTETLTLKVANPFNEDGAVRTDMIMLFIDGQDTGKSVSYTSNPLIWADSVSISSQLENNIMYYTGGAKTFTATIDSPVDATFRDADFIWYIGATGLDTVEREIAKSVSIDPRAEGYMPGTEIRLIAYPMDYAYKTGFDCPYGEIVFTVSGEGARVLDIFAHSKSPEIFEGDTAVLLLASPAHADLMEEGIRYHVKVWEYVGSQNLADYTGMPVWSNMEPRNDDEASVSIVSSSLSLAATSDGRAKYFVYVYFDDGTGIGEEGDTAILTILPRPLHLVFDSYTVYNTDATGSVPISWRATGSGTIKATVEVNGQAVTVNPDGKSVNVPFDLPMTALMDEYIVRVTVTNQYGGSATNNVNFFVYNSNALANEIGSSIVIDNTPKVVGKTSTELLAMRDDLTLIHSIQIDTSNFAWSETNDKLTWQIADNNIADVYYLSANGWTKASPDLALSPFTPIRIIGYQDGQTTLTVTHAKMGFSADISVSVTTLKDQLYFIKTVPEQTSQVMYNGLSAPLQTNSRGEIAIYEPNGIASDITIESILGDDRWIGTIRQNSLVSGENSGGQYPMNSLKLNLLSNIILYAVEPDGRRYQGEVQITGGLFINDVYVHSSQITNQKYNSNTDTTGRIFLQLNTASFGTINAQDTYRYVFEIRFLSGNYEPMLIEIDALYDSREALMSNSFTLYLSNWDRTNPVSYWYNGIDVTREKGSIGVTDENPTGLLIVHAALPDNKLLTKAQIIGINNNIPTSQSSSIIDNLPFLTDISYVAIRWDLNKNTIPVGTSSSFNVIFTYDDGTSRTEKLPFTISNTVGMRDKANAAAYLTIPVNAQVMTTNALGWTRNIPLFPKALPGVNIDVKELDFNIAIEATADPGVYKLHGYVGKPNSVASSMISNINNPLINLAQYGMEQLFWNEYTAVKNDVLLQQYKTNGGQPGVSEPGKLEFGWDYTLNNLKAYVEGELKWNPEKQDFDMIITDGDMIGGASISFSATFGVPVYGIIYVQVGAEAGISNEFNLDVYKTNEIMVTNEFVIYDKLFAGPYINLYLVRGGVDVYAQNSWSLEYGSRYDVDSRIARQATRYSKSVSAGIEGWVWTGWEQKIWTPWKTYKITITLLNLRGTLWSDRGVAYSINLSGDNSIWNNKGIVSLSTPISVLNTIDMATYSDSFLLQQGTASLDQPVLLSNIPAYPEDDLGAVIAGDSTFAVAAWVSLNPRVSADYLDALEDADEVSLSELISLANQFEISVSVYDGTAWSDPPLMLTDNNLSDGSPVVAVDSVNNRAVVVWQRLILKDNGADGMDATTELWYSVYDSGKWATPSRLDYVGDSWLAEYQVAINNSGFAVITGNSDEDVSDVTVYFVNWNDNIAKTVLTNRNALSVNPQIVASQNGFYLSWFSYSEDGNDIVVKKLYNDGTVDNQSVLSVTAVSGVSALNPTLTYLLVGNGDQAVILCRAYDFIAQGDAIYALKIMESGGKLSLSAPMTVVEPQSGYWLEITGGELNGNSVIVEYAKMKEPDGPINDDDITIHRTQPMSFENTILGGAMFNNLDVVVNNDLIVTFGVANTGMDAIDSVVITVDGKTYVTSNSLIQPGAISAFDVTLPVGVALKDFSYTISVDFTNGDTASYTGILALAKPDVSIGKITTLVAEKGQREFSINLFNDGYIPLKDTGYEVRLSFFEDPMCTTPAAGVIGQTSITSMEDLELIDEGGLNLHYSYTIPHALLDDGEIPSLGIWLYIRAEIWDGTTFVEQRSYLANQVAFAINSLVRYGEPSVVITADTELGTDGTTANLHIINRSMRPLSSGTGTIRAYLYDADGNVLEVKSVVLTNSLSAEDSAMQSLQFSKSGAYVLATFTSGGVICGDVNGDGRVSAMDVTLLERWLAGVSGVVIDLGAADVNGDGRVTAMDATILARHVAGVPGYENLPYKSG